MRIFYRENNDSEPVDFGEYTNKKTPVNELDEPLGEHFDDLAANGAQYVGGVYQGETLGTEVKTVFPGDPKFVDAAIDELNRDMSAAGGYFYAEGSQ